MIVSSIISKVMIKLFEYFIQSLFKGSIRKLKNVKYQPKADFQILGSLRKQLSMTQMVRQKSYLNCISFK